MNLSESRLLRTRDQHATNQLPVYSKMVPPELGHNRETSQRNDFFMMSVGGRDNPIPQVPEMNARLIEDLMRDAARLQLAVPSPLHNLNVIDERPLLELDSDSDDSSMDEEEDREYSDEQIRIITRNSTIVLLRNMQAYLRFMRVDVNNIENETGRTARVVAMDTRIADMERMIEQFEDSNIINLHRRRLFH